MSISDVTDQSFTAPDGAHVIDFHAEWCGPCRQVAPILEKLSADSPSLPVFRVDADTNPALVAAYDVSGLPTVIFIGSDGKIFKTVAGAKPKSLYRDLFDAISQ